MTEDKMTPNRRTSHVIHKILRSSAVERQCQVVSKPLSYSGCTGFNAQQEIGRLA